MSKLQEKSRHHAFSQIVSANVAKATADRDKVIAETVAFIAQFQRLSTHEVKELTRLRQENGNRDLQVVPFSKINNADDLAANLDEKLSIDNAFVLKDGESLRGLGDPAMALSSVEME